MGVCKEEQRKRRENSKESSPEYYQVWQEKERKKRVEGFHLCHLPLSEAMNHRNYISTWSQGSQENGGKGKFRRNGNSGRKVSTHL